MYTSYCPHSIIHHTNHLTRRLPAIVYHPQSATRRLPPTACHPPSTIHRLPSTIPSNIYSPTHIVQCLESTVQRLMSTIHRLPSIVYHPPSTIHRLPSTIIRLPSSVYHHPSTIHSQPSSTCCPPITKENWQYQSSNHDINILIEFMNSLETWWDTITTPQGVNSFSPTFVYTSSCQIPQKLLWITLNCFSFNDSGFSTDLYIVGSTVCIPYRMKIIIYIELSLEYQFYELLFQRFQEFDEKINLN